MKPRVAIAVLVLLTITAASPAPSPFTISDEELAKLTDADIAATETHRQQLLQQAQDNVKKVNEVAQNQGASLSDIQTANADTEKAFGEYKQQAEKDIAKGNAAIAALNKVLKKLHRAKFIACGLVVAICAFLAMKIGGKIGLIVGGAGAIGVCTFIWIWL